MKRVLLDQYHNRMKYAIEARNGWSAIEAYGMVSVMENLMMITEEECNEMKYNAASLIHNYMENNCGIDTEEDNYKSLYKKYIGGEE